MKILVTGGCGFIGSHLVERLVHAGHYIVIVDDLSNGSLANLKNLGMSRKNGSWIHFKVDVSNNDFKTFQKVPNEKYDVIYSLACFPRSLSFENPQRDIEVNVNGNLNVLQLAQKHNAKVVFASNSGIYDATGKMPINEETPDQPKTPYDLDKRHVEYLMRLWHDNFNVPIFVNRFATVYGDRQKCNVPWKWYPVIPSFIDDLLAGKTPTIYWHGNQTRDMIFVDDLVEALVREAQLGVESNYATILGTGVEVSVNQIYELINKYLVEAGLLKKRVEPNRGPKARGDIERMRYDCKKAEKLLGGWKPKVTLEEGIKKVVEWYKTKEEVK